MAYLDLPEAILEAANNGLSKKPKRSVIAPGGEVAWDECCEGMLYVAHRSIVPGYKQGRAESSCPVLLRVTYAIGVLRCVKTLTERGTAPTALQITADGNQTSRDAIQLYNALQCFDPQDPGMRAKLGTWTPLGPEGQCAGGEWELTVTMTVPVSV